MRRDFFELLEYARRLMFNVRIKTNAVMIREPEARRMLELGVDQVQVLDDQQGRVRSQHQRLFGTSTRRSARPQSTPKCHARHGQ